MSAAEEASVDKAIGRLHATSRLVARADCALESADRSGDAPSAGVLADAALAVAGMPGFPVDVAGRVRDRVAALCATWPMSRWAMRLLARLGQEAA